MLLAHNELLSGITQSARTCKLHRLEFPSCHDIAGNTTPHFSHEHQRLTPLCITGHHTLQPNSRYSTQPTNSYRHLYVYILN